jgi:mannose-6-phosphate isomerase-like protein (cupin superfamily)
VIYSETRPWGSFHVLDEGRGFKVKRIVVNPGGRLSLQSHRHRGEHWTVVSGIATVTVGDRVVDLTRSQSLDIPKGDRHRLENNGTEVVEIIEVQFGDYLGEDDIIRYEDIYNRA